jgi:acylphosphatase
LRAIVRGRVQGVGYRDFVETRASALGLKGYVRNLLDGTVETLAEGPKEALDDLLEQLREGPRSARVSAIEVEWRGATGEYADFAVTF